MKELKTENDVKKAVKAMLKEIGAFRFSVAAGGFGGTGGIADDVICFRGRFIACESKRPGRRGEKNGGLSALQVRFKEQVLKAGGLFFRCDGWADIEWIKRILEDL